MIAFGSKSSAGDRTASVTWMRLSRSEAITADADVATGVIVRI